MSPISRSRKRRLTNGTPRDLISIRRVDPKVLAKEAAEEVSRLAQEWQWSREQTQRWVRIWGRPDPPATKFF